MTIFAPTLGLVWKGIEDYGLDPHELFTSVGLDPLIRNDISARVDERQVDELLCLAKEKSRDGAFVFNMVQHAMPSMMGALGLAWLTSASLKKGFGRLQRFGRMVSSVHSMELAEEGNDFVVLLPPGGFEFRDPALRETHRLAVLVHLSRTIHSPAFNPASIDFTQGFPSASQEYFHFFRCDLNFNREISRIVIPLKQASEHLAGFNPQLVQNLDHLVVEQLARMDRNDIVGCTRSEILANLPSGTVSLESVADSMNVSSRTLARKLGEKSESFKSLVAETRRELGEKYIRDKNLTLTEISFLLGFSETSSFSRAYRNWTGMSPREHRANL